MTRLQKKCFLFSIGMHGLLLIILIGSSAFRDQPAPKEIPILTMIPANILDREGAGGGSPEPPAAQPQAQPQMQMQQPQPTPPPTHVSQPTQPVVRVPQPVARPRTEEPVEKPRPREIEPEPIVPPAPEPDAEPRPAKQHKGHEIKVDLSQVTTSAKTSTRTKRSEVQTSEATSAESEARAAEKRLQKLATGLGIMASRVQQSGAQGTVVDMPGQGGGEAFVGYETVIYNAYYHAWVTPDGVANKLAAADVKIVVARDGAILSSEIVNKSGERSLDASVQRALREVNKLPPFPPGAHDEQRTFLIRFNVEAKEGSG